MCNICGYCKSHKLSSAVKHEVSIKLTAHTITMPVYYLSNLKGLQNDTHLTKPHHILLGHPSGHYKSLLYKILYKSFIVKSMNDLYKSLNFRSSIFADLSALRLSSFLITNIQTLHNNLQLPSVKHFTPCNLGHTPIPKRNHRHFPTEHQKTQQ